MGSSPSVVIKVCLEAAALDAAGDGGGAWGSCDLQAVVAAKNLPHGLKCTPISEHSTASEICSFKLDTLSRGAAGFELSNLQHEWKERATEHVDLAV